jgi:hypothetical protein
VAETNVDNDDSLSLAAVGLWHKLHHAFGDRCSPIDVFTVHPNPRAWGPVGEQHDLEHPLNQLLAIGYMQAEGGWFHLYKTLE